MALKTTINQLKRLLENAASDLAKAEGGNKAAAQRVRTGTIKLEKVAKVYRKESISDEKKNKGKPKKKAKPARKTASKKKAAPKRKAAPKKKAAPKRKTASRSTAKKSTRKKATAKIPTRRRAAR